MEREISEAKLFEAKKKEMWILSWFHGKNSLVFIPSDFCFDMTKLIGPSSRIMLRNVEQKSKIPVLYQNKSKFAARVFWEWLFEIKF